MAPSKDPRDYIDADEKAPLWSRGGGIAKNVPKGPQKEARGLEMDVVAMPARRVLNQSSKSSPHFASSKALTLPEQEVASGSGLRAIRAAPRTQQRWFRTLCSCDARGEMCSCKGQLCDDDNFLDATAGMNLRQKAQAVPGVSHKLLQAPPAAAFGDARSLRELLGLRHKLATAELDFSQPFVGSVLPEALEAMDTMRKHMNDPSLVSTTGL